MATCLIDMFPEDPHFAWTTFSAELKKIVDEGKGKNLLEALTAIAEDGEKKDELIRFVSYHCFVAPLPIVLS